MKQTININKSRDPTLSALYLSGKIAL